MANAIFFNIPTHGHINPTLPLVQGLVQAGDRITYYAGPNFAEKIRATGAAYGDYGDAYTFESTRTEVHAVQQGGQLAEATRALLPVVLDAVEALQPDYLLFDMSAPWGNIAAQRLNIPAVASFPHLPFNWRVFYSDPRVLKKGLHSLRPGQGYYRDLQQQLRKLAKAHNLRKPSEINVLSSSAELNIVFSSRYFQPAVSSFDDSYQFIGPVINTQRPDDSASYERDPGRKLIYIAVGTLYQADPAFFQYCMQAFAGDAYDVIMSVGKATDPAVLGAVPDNFSVAQFVPQLAILEEADLFITHGGLNSINEAVLALVPMIVVPNTVEQAVNALRVEQLQGGRYLEPAAVNITTLRETAQNVLANGELQNGLRQIRNSFLEAGGIGRGVEIIQSLKSSHGIS